VLYYWFSGARLMEKPIKNEQPRPKGRGIVVAIYVVDTPQAAGNVPKEIQRD
jgi:hypothetical protein